VGEVSASVSNDPPKEVETPPPRDGRDARAHVSLAGGPREGTIKETPASPDSATFVFQALGYIVTQDGDTRAIVAEGAEVYLVTQGDTFADQYRAISVDATLVLAVRVPARQNDGNVLSAQAESGGKSASKRLYGNLHFPLSELAKVQTLQGPSTSASQGSADLGVNLINSSLTGFELQSQFFMAESFNLRF
jgi:hypothetical protein